MHSTRHLFERHPEHSALKQKYRGARSALTLLFFILSKIIFSCECPLYLPPVSLSVLKNYDVVFYGKVDSVSPCTTKGLAIAYFTIDDLYKGKVTQEVEVNFDCSSECMMSFAKNEKWLIYAKFEHFDQLLVSFCEHSRKDDAQLISVLPIEKEKALLKEICGTHEFIEKNELNLDQEVMNGRNEQPSSMNKLWLLLISFGAMGIVYFISRNKKK